MCAEYGYTEAWRNYLQGHRPRHIKVADQRYKPHTTAFSFQTLQENDDDDEEEEEEEEDEEEEDITPQVIAKQAYPPTTDDEEEEEEEDGYGYGDENDIYLPYLD